MHELHNNFLQSDIFVTSQILALYPIFTPHICIASDKIYIGIMSV